MPTIKNQKRVLFSRTLTSVVLGVLSLATILYGGFALHSQQVSAATNSTINFQARLEGAGGAIAPDGYYNIQFKLYSASSGGVALWTESYYDSNGVTAGNDNRVQTINGYVTVNLGSQTVFPSTINWDQELYITMNVGGTTQTATPTYDGEMSPRLRLTGVPYAFRAGQVAQFNNSTGFTSTLNILQPTGGNQTLNVADQGAAGTYTICVQGATTANGGCAPTTGGTGYIQNGTGLQTSSNFYISGTGRADTSITTPLLDTATSVALNIGTTNASVINLNEDTTIAAGKTLTANGTALFRASTNSATAFQIQNTTSGQLLNVDTIGGNITLNGINSGDVQSWTTNTNSLPAVRQAAATVTANGFIYVMGGYGAGANQSTVYYSRIQADGSTASWTTSANPLPAVRYGATATVANGYVYVIGGSDNGGYVSTVYYAKLNSDGSTGSWTTSSNPLPAVRGAARSAVANGYVYVVGGYNGTTVSSAVAYAKLNPDGSTGSWTVSANSLPAARMGGGLDVANGFLYYTGGFDSGLSLVSTVYYAVLNADGTTNAWNTNANALPAVRGAHASAVLNGYLYVIGGDAPAGASASTVYFASINSSGGTGTWTTSANSLPGARSDAGTGSALVANGYLYVIGGFNGTGSTYHATVFYASTSRIMLGGSLDLVGLGGPSLAAGSTGGSLTAGNTFVSGTLQVTKSANFMQGASLSGDLSLTGSIGGGTTYTATTSLQAPLLDTATAVALNIGTTNATVINLNENVTTAVGKSLAVGATTTFSLGTDTHLLYDAGNGVFNMSGSTGDFNTGVGSVFLNGTVTVVAGKSLRITGSGTRPASPTEGMLYYDTTTKHLLTYANGKWQSNRSAATAIVAASNSTQIAKDGAGYVADGENSSGSGTGTIDGDQIQINAALTAASAAGGGTVYLTEGTFTIDASISIPNGVTLAGSGASTIIQLGNFGATSVTINAIVNTDTTTGTEIGIRDLKLDGRNSLNTVGTQTGIYMNGMGAYGRPGAKLTGIWETAFLTNGIYLNASAYNTITNSTVRDNGSVGITLASASNNNIISNNYVEDSGVGGIYTVTSSNTNVISGNTITGSGAAGINIDTSAYNAVTGNTVNLSIRGVSLDGASYNSVTGNTLLSNNVYGISVVTASTYNNVSSNKVHDSGGSTANNGIRLISSDSNTITSNDITDTACSTTCYAIDLSNAASDTNYMADNRFSSTSGSAIINDVGIGTVYANQARTANGGQLTLRTANDSAAYQIQNASGNQLFTADTSAGNIVLGKASTLNTTLQFSNATNANIVGLKVADGTAAYTLTLPSTAPNVGDCLKAGAVTATSLIFGTCAGAGGGVTLQGSTPGSPDTGHINITGTAIAGASVLTPLIDIAAAGAFNIGTTNATVINLNQDTVVATGKTFTVQGAVSTLTSNTTSGDALVLSNSTSTGNILTAKDNTTTVASIANGGATLFQNAADSATAFQIQNSSAANLFVADSSNNRILIGGGNVSANSTPTLHILDHNTSATDPTGIDGAMYYSESSGAFRCYTNGMWKYCSTAPSSAYTYRIQEDFLGNDTVNNRIGTHGWSGTGAGTGAGAQKQATDSYKHPGILVLRGGITATGRLALHLGDLTDDAMSLGGGEEIEMGVSIPVLSTVSEEYIVRMGMCDVVNGDCVDGVYFEYDRLTSTNWRIATANNSTRTKTTTSTAVTAAAYVNLKIVMNDAATLVTFYINGTSVGTSATNIPTGTTRATNPMFQILKSAGTNSTGLVIDYFDFQNSFTSTR